MERLKCTLQSNLLLGFLSVFTYYVFILTLYFCYFKYFNLTISRYYNWRTDIVCNDFNVLIKLKQGRLSTGMKEIGEKLQKKSARLHVGTIGMRKCYVYDRYWYNNYDYIHGVAVIN